MTLEKLVFLGAIDQTTLMETVDEKEQVHILAIIVANLSFWFLLCLLVALELVTE